MAKKRVKSQSVDQATGELSKTNGVLPAPLSDHPIPDAGDHLGPEAWADFHPCGDFLDPLADSVESWQAGDEDTVRDIEQLLSSLSLYEVPEELGRLWLEVNKPEVGKAFESKRSQVVGKARSLLKALKGLDPRGEEWRHHFISFGMNIVQPFVEYLRGLSVIVRQESPKKKYRSVAGRGPGRPKMSITKQRADFGEFKRKQGWTWPEVLEHYQKKYPEDIKASTDILRTAYNREYSPSKKRRKPT